MGSPLTSAVAGGLLCLFGIILLIPYRIAKQVDDLQFKAGENPKASKTIKRQIWIMCAIFFLMIFSIPNMAVSLALAFLIPFSIWIYSLIWIRKKLIEYQKITKKL